MRKMPGKIKSPLGILQLAVLGIFCSCAVTPSSMYYEFIYDLREDDLSAVVLNFQLSSGSAVQIAANEKLFKAVGGSKTVRTTKFGPEPTDFYVRWKDTKTGREYERNVDLRGKLPDDINNRTIYFTLFNDQLQIYLASDPITGVELRKDGPNELRRRPIVVIYSN